VVLLGQEQERVVVVLAEPVALLIAVVVVVALYPAVASVAFATSAPFEQATSVVEGHTYRSRHHLRLFVVVWACWLVGPCM